MSNRPEWLLVDFAATMLGATLVPSARVARPQLAYVLDHCDATTLITVARLEVRTIWPCWPSSASGIVASSRSRPRRDRRPRADVLCDLGAAVDDAELDARSAPSARRRRLHPYTSRHDIHAKGVQLQHRGSSRTCGTSASASTSPADDRMWMGISLFWSFGGANALLAVMTHVAPCAAGVARPAPRSR